MRLARLARLAVSAVALIATAALATACATGSTPAVTPVPPPTTDTGTSDMEIEAAWLDDGSAIGILTYGSSTCVPTPGDPTYADGVLTVPLDDPEAAACTRDLVARGSYVTLPDGVDPAADLEVVLTGSYDAATSLEGDPALAGEGGGIDEGAPSAGWAEDDVFLLLTWGSSGCPPLISAATAGSPTEVTVTIEPLPADQVCTADFAPRVSVVAVEGLPDDGDEPVEAVLTGDEYDDARIPILGTR